MQHIVVFFVKLDATIQKCFDSTCFFLMRRFGVRKSAIRYTISTVIIVSILGKMAHGMMEDKAMKADWISSGFNALLMLYTQNKSHAEDIRAERTPSTLSLADRLQNSHLLSLLKTAFAVFLMVRLALVLLAPRLWNFTFTCSILIDLAFLCLFYLVRTPMNPPAEKVRATILTAQLTPAQT